MLLRIDVFPADGNPEMNLESPSSTLYACLATASDDGRLVTVGRKMGNILLPKDKSVSREHCSLRLVSVNKTHDIPQPKTPEQIEACQDSIDHMCIILENKGKLGSYVVVEETPTAHNSKNDGDDSDTDEEEAVMQSQMSIGVPLSTVSQKLASDKAHLKVVGPEQSLVLNQLCKTNDDDNDSTSTKRVIVQVGKLGSTLVITRETFRIVRSGADKKTAWKSRYHAIGVEEMGHVDSTTTYLITPSLTTSTKQLIAWCLGIPHVTNDYLQALLDRSQPTDPLPNPSDYSPKTDDNSFWNTQANPKLWSSCTLLSIKHDDMEGLVQAAGASVVPLYDMPEEEALQKAQALMEDPSQSCFCMNEARRKLTRRLTEMGVPAVTSKDLAKCMTEQELLKDNKGNVIGNVVVQEPDIAVEEPAQYPMPPVSPDIETTIIQKDDHSCKKRKSVRDKEPSETEGRSKKRGKAVTEKDKHEAAPSKQTATEEDNAAQDRPKKRDKPSNENESKKEAIEEEPPSKRSKTDGQDKCAQEPLQPSNKKERKKLEVSTSGWLTAAPKGKKRSDYIRPKKEIQEKAGYDELIEVAPTDRCKGLIVQKNVPSQNLAAKRSKKASGPDFKRFRKNTIARSKVLPCIQLRSVLPKESEQHREFEEERRALEEQQRKADELFCDPVRTAASRRRRR